MPRAFLALLLLLGGAAPFLAPSGVAFLRTVAATSADAGNNYDPNGAPRTDAGGNYDPNGQPGTDAGGNWDPDGQAETDAGGNWDPNG